VLPVLHLAVGPWHVVVSTYALALLAAFVAGACVLRARCPPAPPPPALVAGAITLGVAAGARGIAAVLHGARGGDGGFSSAGALLGGVAAALIVAGAVGVPRARLLDAVAPAGLVAFGIGRVGCFLAGCCYGRPTTLPWGIVVGALGPPARHPAALYEAVGDLLLAIVATRAGSPGAAARRTAVGYAALRIALERVRDPAATDLLGGVVPLAPAVAFAFACVAAHPCALGRLRLCLARSCPTQSSHGGPPRMADEKLVQAFKEMTVHSGHREMSVEDLATIQPGLGRIMPDIGTRTWKLFYAAKAGNWPLAKFQWKEIRGLMELGSFTRPKYEQNLADFMEQQWKPIEEAIAKEDFALFEKRFHEAVEQANAYHELRDKPYLRWKLPDGPPPDLDLTPRKKK
jgi:prolipoprotein diacylglyceryltransferase